MLSQFLCGETSDLLSKVKVCADSRVSVLPVGETSAPAARGIRSSQGQLQWTPQVPTAAAAFPPEKGSATSSDVPPQRSFAIVIQQLPAQLRDPVCVFYLVLRALDTVEDDMSVPDGVKLPLLRSFHEKCFDRCRITAIKASETAELEGYTNQAG